MRTRPSTGLLMRSASLAPPQVRLDHHAGQLFHGGLRLPAERGFSFGIVSEQSVDLRGPEELLVDRDARLPARRIDAQFLDALPAPLELQVGSRKRGGDEVAHRAVAA